MKGHRPVRYVALVIAAAAVGLCIWGVTHQVGHLAGGDPGGRILTQIAPVAEATPDGAKLNYRQLSEPRVDSCDGRPSTRGWSQAVVQINFNWNRSPQEAIDLVNKKMQSIGWTLGPKGQENFLPAQEWDKQLSNGTTSYTHLEAEPGGESWNLISFAQPEGKRVTGC